MAVSNFSTDLLSVSVNGRSITDWGATDPPFTNAPIDPSSTLRRGLGRNATRLDRINPGRTVTLNLNPGSRDSSFMQGFLLSKATITLTYYQITTLEGAVGAEGVITNDGSVDRGGVTISDDQYIIEFNTWTQTKGGNE